MGGFGRWWSNFMTGRYGMDQLNRFLLYTGLVLVLIGLFIHMRWLSLLTVIILIILYCRMFSRSHYNRQRENQKFLEIKDRVFSRKSAAARPKNDGKRVLICPYCKEKLRVPVGAGKIKIKCPHCNRDFEEIV